MQSDPPASDPQQIGNAFVEQYYTILHKDPSYAYKFYLDLSVLSRPCPDGSMKSVTTLKEINELILSLDSQSYRAEISCADAQFSLANSVIVLVTGSLIGTDDVRRKFTQSFFLAPQEGGYYVLNDLFRYVDDKESVDVAYDDVDESSQAALAQDAEVTPLPDNAAENHSTAPLSNDDNSIEEVSHPLDNDKLSVPENGVVSEQLPPPAEKSQKDSRPVSQTTPAIVKENAPKKSYLSVVHALTNNSAPFKAPPPKPKPAEQSQKSVIPEESAPKSNKTPERNNESSGKNASIFVANLPMNTTEETLKEVFQKFGSIKPNGIQVRSFKNSSLLLQCKVLLRLLLSRLAADKPTSKKSEARPNNGGRPGWGGYKDENGYRNDNFRGRGNLNGNRNFRKNERSELSGQARGSTGRNGDANRNINQNGGQRVTAN
ncbi:hypothetical protein V6N13_055511 [Hibiscus sabdariffa]